MQTLPAIFDVAAIISRLINYFTFYTMKKLIILLVPFFFACKSYLSDSDKDLLIFKIQLHNGNASLKWVIDSIANIGEVRIQMIQKSIPKKETEEYLKLNMSLFKSHWNQPYDIKKDMLLTLPKYIEYCTAYNYDPKTYIDLMDK